MRAPGTGFAALVARAPGLVIGLVVALLEPGWSQAQSEPFRAQGPPVAVFEALGARPALSARGFAGALASHPVRVRFDALARLDGASRVVFPLSADERWEGAVQRIERRTADSYSVFGTLEGTQEGWFILTVDSGGLMALFGIPDRNLIADLRNLDGDEYAVCAFEAGKAGRFACGVSAPSGAAPRIEAVPPSPVVSSITAITPPSPQHDVVVLYTQGLINDFPNHFPNTPLDTAVQLLVDYANLCYSNSGVSLHMRLAYRGLAQSGFSEAGHDRNWLLDRLAGTSDGVLDNVHGLRTTYHADIVCLLYSLDTQQAGGGGLAYMLGPATFNAGNPGAWYGSAFCVVEALWEPSSFDPPVGGMVPTEFAHEIGHTQGMDHNCEDSGGTPVTSYAYGWRFTGNSSRKYVDVMAYMTGVFSNAATIPFFGNASVVYDGQPTGSTAPGCGGATTGAQTAVALNLTADFMSRLRLQPLDPWVDFNSGGIPNGRFEAPWTTFATAAADLPPTDATHTPTPPTVFLKGPAATGTLSMTVNKRMRVEARGGAVRMGAP